jgi:hypothetical protein
MYRKTQKTKNMKEALKTAANKQEMWWVTAAFVKRKIL